LFDLYVVQQWPVKKVTAALGVSAGQVYLAKHRVGALLKKERKRSEGDG
jgi:RNA polymerase sigma-70 factor (ECF subfamily)